MRSQPRFLQGTFAFAGAGLDSPGTAIIDVGLVES